MAASAERPAIREVAIQNPNGYRGLGTATLEPWLERLVKELAGDATSLTVRFLSDDEMRDLNNLYRQRDRPTDVLSFPGDRGPEGFHLGDIAIAVPTARRQAVELGHSLERELKCLVLHGVLHCLGHDHESDSGEMHRLELELRRSWVDAGGDPA